jgi:hypothetical protein
VLWRTSRKLLVLGRWLAWLRRRGVALGGGGRMAMINTLEL